MLLMISLLFIEIDETDTKRRERGKLCSKPFLRLPPASASERMRVTEPVSDSAVVDVLRLHQSHNLEQILQNQLSVLRYPDNYLKKITWDCGGIPQQTNTKLE
ncbi:hypothetical protein L2E82_04635 [Cichorium intybus]|uniref:Uncharacterized protein n=1 Tax=Cichorium intybus TaxID=13427 RepID=A0ACB9H5C4_CICIN|nr:hypothetical protein L2E82_04635 [Cichorium intybus]